MERKLERVQELMSKDAPPQRAAQELGQGVAVHRSLPFAIYSFLRCPDSFEDCLFCAVLNGGDRDTVGAIACAISGAYLGAEAIPQAWRGKLENRRRIEELAVALEGMA
jgi:poly(ADP-ribose) glycohydrolase ARH3